VVFDPGRMMELISVRWLECKRQHVRVHFRKAIRAFSASMPRR
jgi:hypothetical protein